MEKLDLFHNEPHDWHIAAYYTWKLEQETGSPF